MAPTAQQAVASFLLALVAECIIYRDAIAFTLAKLANVPTSTLQIGGAHVFRGVTVLPALASAFIVIFYSIAGALVYFATLALHSSFVDAHNTLTVQENFTGQGPWSLKLHKTAVQASFGILVIAVIVVTAFYLMPLWTSLFTILLTGPFHLYALVSSILALAGFSINIYAIWMLVLLTLTYN